MTDIIPNWCECEEFGQPVAVPCASNCPTVRTRIEAELKLGQNVKLLNNWAAPGKYWFVMPPKPGKTLLYILHMNNGKGFEGKSHDEVIQAASDWLRENQ